MGKNKDDRIIEELEEFVSEHKKEFIDRVLHRRTRHLTLVFEDIEKPHNINAVLRTAECMGIQDIHFIQNNKGFEINTSITQGAAKWLSFYTHPSPESVENCYNKLRNEGYAIYATSLHETSISINDIDPGIKTAIVFGTESDGISKEAGEKADGFVHIPMQGFTESYNLSVSAALCLNTLMQKLEAGFPPISTEEQKCLKAEWYRRIVREADLILKKRGVVL
ncbi:MAG: RNA methyltransferase [Cyclobacteriaceae bacterium]